jgi:3-hydroxyacyl-[acyl-carrier-protein] dehydratase
MNAVCDYAAPLLAVDQILEIDDRKIRTAKAIAGNEPFFPGHYPGYPIFPGNFIFEAAHQTIRYYVTKYLKSPAWARLAEIRSIRFLTPLRPGDRLEIVCRCTFSTERNELFVDVDCLCGEGKAVAKMKLLYLLDES